MPILFLQRNTVFRTEKQICGFCASAFLKTPVSVHKFSVKAFAVFQVCRLKDDLCRSGSAKRSDFQRLIARRILLKQPIKFPELS